MFGILSFGLVNYIQTNVQRKKLQKHIEHLPLVLEKSHAQDHTDTGTFVPLKEIEKNIGKKIEENQLKNITESKEREKVNKDDMSNVISLKENEEGMKK